MAIVRLAYKLTSDRANIIDIARGLSLTERRLVHQKQVFTVMGAMISDQTSGLVKISTAPNNYYTRNAVTRGFRAWKAMRKKALESDSSLSTPKYSDFKVLLDNTNSGYYLNPYAAGDVAMNTAEWETSVVTAEDGSAPKNFMIVGRDHTASRYSLAKGWLETRPVPSNAQPEQADLNADGVEDVTVDYLATLFQDTTEQSERINLIVDENDKHPYNLGETMTTQSAYSSSQPNNLQLQFIGHTSSSDSHYQVPGFQALCGLIRVDVSGGSDPWLILDVETKGWNF